MTVFSSALTKCKGSALERMLSEGNEIKRDENGRYRKQKNWHFSLRFFFFFS